MGAHAMKTRRIGIAIKIVLAAGTAILLLLSINGVIFLNMESNLVDSILEEYVKKVNGEIEEQGKNQTKTLQENVSIHAKVLGNAAATFLYNLDKASMERMLDAYIRLPELKAVKVIDEEGATFFSIWKNPDVQVGKEIPGNVVLDEKLSGKADAFVKEERVGKLYIYFTDEIIKARMDRSKQKAKTDLASFQSRIDDEFNRSIWIQAGVIFGVVLILALVIVFTMKTIAIKPIQLVAEGARRFALGDIALEGMNWNEIEKINKRGDELGDTVRAFSSLTKYMQEKVKAAGEIAKGNLGIDVDMKSKEDQLGKALVQMLESLNQVVGDLYSAAEKVDRGSRQVSDSSQSLSQGATEQAASLEQITSSMAEINKQTKTNAENATQANNLSASAQAAGKSGVEKMETMMAAIGSISASGKEIEKIIKVIDDIAFQTNLLALNAAVEAARAGKHGKGFAVVAQEVRSLAARSAKAAQETAVMIEGSVRKVEEGSRIAKETSQALNEISESITKATDLVGEIAAASNEQAQGISQINQGLAQIDGVTQQNTANAEETSSAAEELTALSAEVRTLLSRFQLKGRVLHRDLPGPKKPSSSVPVREKEKIVKPMRKPVEIPWGQQPESTGYGEVKQIEPSKVIALDDHEFGKY